MPRPRIFVTNDDGIESPGLRAAVAAVLPLGDVVVVAPRYQQSSKGRSLGGDRAAPFERLPFQVGDTAVEAYALDGTPAQTVLHAFDVFADRWPALVVSGINYGENLGANVSISGTIGAAIEAASRGVPALAMSLQTDHHNVFSDTYGEIDWSIAEHFTGRFAEQLLVADRTPDVDVLNVVVPDSADTRTRWRLTRQSRRSYFSTQLTAPSLTSTVADTAVGVYLEREDVEPDSDIWAILFDRVVSATPLSLDATSRTDFAAFDRAMRSATVPRAAR
ncbi:MAG: 5'/3'-nucleotidase SurE [Verrucomicrobia bacterium]|nr:5'/3'-nucleotidase SurE [Verrucomicrobiota bacterium]